MPVGAGDKIVCTYTNTLNMFSPTITTSLVPSSAAIGASVHDTATLHSASSDAGGTVTYRYYPSAAACTSDTSHTGGTPAGTVTVTNGVVPPSSNVSFSTATTVYWQAVYSGDAKNNSAVSDCSSEPLTINPNTPAIHTTLSSSSTAVGSTVHDSANLTGATGNAGGTVSYAVYTNNTCTTLATIAGDGISGQPTGGNVG